MWLSILDSQSDPAYHTRLYRCDSESQMAGGQTARLAGFSRIWVWGQAGACSGSTREGSRVGAASSHRAAFQGEEGPARSSCGGFLWGHTRVMPVVTLHTGCPFSPAEPISSDWVEHSPLPTWAEPVRKETSLQLQLWLVVRLVSITWDYPSRTFYFITNQHIICIS